MLKKLTCSYLLLCWGISRAPKMSSNKCNQRIRLKHHSNLKKQRTDFNEISKRTDINNNDVFNLDL